MKVVKAKCMEGCVCVKQCFQDNKCLRKDGMCVDHVDNPRDIIDTNLCGSNCTCVKDFRSCPQEKPCTQVGGRCINRRKEKCRLDEYRDSSLCPSRPVCVCCISKKICVLIRDVNDFNLVLC
ncbi:uncharacterized protein LOC143030868 [Oratosquilla oratoria]|uniref:uncharacterized protein LOC143030866 n=1 Tax=Oratosquilla oratoria TaxID=337810 RepID=UPI003F75D819